MKSLCQVDLSKLRTTKEPASSCPPLVRTQDDFGDKSCCNSNRPLLCPFAHSPAAVLAGQPFFGAIQDGVSKSHFSAAALFLATLPKDGNKDPCFTLFRVHLTSDLTLARYAAVSLLRALLFTQR